MSMSRTIENIPYRSDFPTIKNRIDSFLSGNGFTLTQIKTGETVWKKGTGLMTAMQFVKVEYGNGNITLSAWVSTGVGNFTANEMSLDGITAVAAKKPLKNLLTQLKTLIY